VDELDQIPSLTKSRPTLPTGGTEISWQVGMPHGGRFSSVVARRRPAAIAPAQSGAHGLCADLMFALQLEGVQEEMHSLSAGAAG